MATPLPQTWPPTEELPQRFQQNSYTEGNINNLIQTKMDSGPTKRRKRTTKAYKPFSGTMIMSTEEKLIFEEFFTDEIAYGALPFTMPSPIEGVAWDVYLDNHSMKPINGTKWSVNMSFRTLI
jgi:hypothetical protein